MTKVEQMVNQVGAVKPQRATGFASTEPSMPKPSVIAGTSKGLRFLGPEPRTELDGHRVTALVPGSDGLWAIVDRNSVWHRDSNSGWHVAASVKDLQLNCILPINGTVLVGTSEAHLMRVIDGEVEMILSFETVEGRDEWYTPWGGPPDVRSLAVGPLGEIYVNVHVGGILRSDDQGQSWQPTINIHSDIHEVRTIRDHPGLVLAATAEGLATSKDRGNSWQFDRANLHAAYSRAVALSGKTVLVSASTGPHGDKAAIYRRLLEQPGTFEKSELGLPTWFSDNINTGTLDTFQDTVAFGTSDGEIFISDDAGLTWQQIASGLAPIHCLRLSD